MQTIDDARGIPYTVNDAEELEAFYRVIDAYLLSRSDTMDLLNEMLEQEYPMPMAICFRGYLLKMVSNPKLNPAIQKCLEQLRTADLNDRERVHLEALDAWSTHRSELAKKRLEEHLDSYPLDLVALRVVHHLHFYSGDSKGLCRSVGDRLGTWSEHDCYYGHLLGMHAFGLEESAEYREAEIVGRRACEINPQDIWAGHAMAHVFQMQGRWVDGIDWMRTMSPHWQDGDNFLNHMQWHHGLYHYGRSDYDAVLSIYDQYLSSALDDDFYLDTCNASSLLWRLNMKGIDTGDRWQHLYKHCKHRVEDDELVFCSLHYLMAPAVVKDQLTIDKSLTHFENWRRHSTTQGEVANTVGAGLAQAIVDLAAGNSNQGAASLARLRGDVKHIGGSWAQRQLFKDLQEYY